MNFHEIFSTRIKALRLLCGLSQKEVAEHLDVSPTQISDMEKGKTLTTIERLVKMALFYNVTPDYLLGFADNPNSLTRQNPGQYSQDEISLLELYEKLPPNLRHEAKWYMNALQNRDDR